MGDFGNGVCQDGQTLGGAVLTVGELFRRMQPLIWQIFSDGVMMIEHDDGEIVPGAMTGRQTFALRDDNDFLIGRDGQSFAEGGIAPAEADHFVVFGPVEKGVVGGVKDDEAASVTDICDESFFDFGRPACAGGVWPPLKLLMTTL